MHSVKIFCCILLCCLMTISVGSAASAAPATRVLAVEVLPAESPASDAVTFTGINIFAAASLREVFTGVRREFIKMYPGIQVRMTFAGSDHLLQKMQQGAEVDVFASADQLPMDAAEAADLLEPESRQNFAANSLVLVVPVKGKFVDVQGLSKPTTQYIAIGNPKTMSAGRYARDALKKVDLWERLQGKYIMGESARQVLDYVVRGQVDTGVVYGSDAHQAQAQVKVSAVLRSPHPLLYPVAVARNSQHKAAAQAFVAFVCSKKGQRLLEKAGFLLVKNS